MNTITRIYRHPEVQDYYKVLRGGTVYYWDYVDTCWRISVYSERDVKNFKNFKHVATVNNFVMKGNVIL